MCSEKFSVKIQRNCLVFLVVRIEPWCLGKILIRLPTKNFQRIHRIFQGIILLVGSSHGWLGARAFKKIHRSGPGRGHNWSFLFKFRQNIIWIIIIVESFNFKERPLCVVIGHFLKRPFFLIKISAKHNFFLGGEGYLCHFSKSEVVVFLFLKEIYQSWSYTWPKKFSKWNWSAKLKKNK